MFVNKKCMITACETICLVQSRCENKYGVGGRILNILSCICVECDHAVVSYVRDELMEPNI